MGTGPTTGERTATARLVYLDNLKVVLIGLIIVLHAILGYSSLEVWNYSEFREVTLSPAVEIPLSVLASPFGLFIIGLLFLVAGLFTRPSLERKGVVSFVRDRLLRLGVTFVVYVLVVQPTVTYAMLEHPLGDAPGSYWQEYLAEGKGHRLDSGPLWFVGVLLIFSLGYAIWVGVRRTWGDPATAAALTTARVGTGRLALLAALVGAVSFVVRIGAPYGSEAGVLDLNYWEWPGCLAAFLLGIVASGQGWLEEVPDDLRRHGRMATLAGAVAMSLVLLVGGMRDVVAEQVMGGRHWLALGFSLAECVLVVFGPVWLLSVARRRLVRPLPWGAALARSAFGAFIVQTPVLLGLAMALRPVDLPAEVKALVVATGGVAVSFALAWLLVTRVPGVRRIL